MGPFTWFRSLLPPVTPLESAVRTAWRVPLQLAGDLMCARDNRLLAACGYPRGADDPSFRLYLCEPEQAEGRFTDRPDDADHAALDAEHWSVHGHAGSVTSLAWSGTVLVSGSRDRSAAVWDMENRAPVTRFDDLEAPVFDVAIHDDLVAAGGGPDMEALIGFGKGTKPDPVVYVWRLNSGQPPAVLRRHRETVGAVAFLDHERLVAGSGVSMLSSRPELLLWDLGAGTSRSLGHHGSPVADIDVALDGSEFHVLSDDGTIHRWDVAGLENHRAGESREDIRLVAISPDGRRVVTASWDELPRLWDTASVRPVTDLIGHRNLIRTVAFAPDGRTVITGAGPKYPRPGGDTTARLWDAETGDLLAVLDRHRLPVTLARFSTNRQYIVTGESDPRSALSDVEVIHVWDAHTFEHVEQIGEHRPDGIISLISRGNPGRLRDGIAAYGIEIAWPDQCLRGEVSGGVHTTVHTAGDPGTPLGWLPTAPSDTLPYASATNQPIIAFANGADLNVYRLERG